MRTVWHIYRDGTHIAGPFDSHLEATGELHRRQGQSVHHATTYEGWEIRPEEEAEAEGEEEPYCDIHDIYSCPLPHSPSRIR